MDNPLLVKNADGNNEGRDPREISRDVLASRFQPRPLGAVIREKCLDCCAGQINEVKRCTATMCALWPYRMGTNPFSNRKGNPAALHALHAAQNAEKRPGLPMDSAIAEGAR